MRRPLTIWLLVFLAPLFSLALGAVAAERQGFTVTVIGGEPQIQYENSGAKEQGADMPWVSRNGSIRGVTYVKDANEAPMVFDYLRLFEVVGATQTLIAEDDTDRTITNDLTLWSLDLAAGPVGAVRRFVSELRFRELVSPFWTVARYANEVQVASPLPSQANWRRFDLHLHTFATDTQFEWGMTVPHMALQLSSIGLDGAFFTDHGESMTDARWATQGADCAANSNGSRLLRRGIEANVDANFSNEFPDIALHLTCYGLTRPLKTPAEYFCANQGFQLWTLPQLLDSLEVQGGVAFAAHPASSIQLFEYNVMTTWPDSMFLRALDSPAFLGVEFHNQRITKDTEEVGGSNVDPFATWAAVPNWEAQYDAGMRQFQWLIRQVLAMAGGDVAAVRPVFCVGGSDAHGGANFSRFNALGQFDLKVNDSAIGKIHTVLLMPSGLTEAAALAALRAGQMLVSDGPLVVPQVRLPNDAVLPVGSRVPNPTDAVLEINGSSPSEFGPVTQAIAMRVTATAVDTLPLAVGGSSMSVSLPLESLADPSQGAALILEFRTAGGFRCVANPFWVGPATATDASVDALAAWVRLVPNPAREEVRILWGRQRPLLIDAFDVRGRRVWITFPDGQSLVVSTAKLPAGVYFVRGHFRDRITTEKFTIVRQ